MFVNWNSDPICPWYGGREGQYSRFYFDLILLCIDFPVVEFCYASIFAWSNSVPLRFLIEVGVTILNWLDFERLRFSIIIRRGREQNRPRLLLLRIKAVQNRSSSESSWNRIDHAYFYQESKRFRIEWDQNPKRNGIESIPLRFDPVLLRF